MKAVIMAGGYGTRLRPLTVKTPKPMIPVANRPMLEHVVLLLKRHGFSDIVILTYFFPESIEGYFGDGSAWNVNITYRQDPPGGLGTAGAVKNAGDIIDGTFMVISGDVITDFDLTRAVEFHRGRENPATMVLTRVHNPLPFGVVIIDDDLNVSSFLEKPTWGEVFSDTINTGIYILEPEVLDRIPMGSQTDFSRDVFPAMLEEGKPPAGYIAEGYWKDVGNPVEYLQTHRELASGILSLDIPGKLTVTDTASVYAGEGSVIDDGAKLSGMVVVGDGAVIDADARVEDSFIGRGSHVNRRIRMKSAVVWDNVTLEPGAFIAGSVIGSGTTVKTRANVEEGSIISENCVLGRGSIVRAGVRIWPDKVVEEEAILSTHFVWGSRWRGTLFTTGVIRGMSNKEITPEFAARLGAAFGATLPANSVVSISRGMHRASRMIAEALSSGVLSVGVDVHEYGVAPIPVTRYQMGVHGEMGGIHVRRSPTDPEVLEIRLYRERGKGLTAAERNEVDRLFFRMDFTRVSMEDSGTMSAPDYGTEKYEKGFLKSLNIDVLSRAQMRIVVDYSHGSTLKVLPSLLGKTRAEVISLNAHLDGEKSTRTTKQFDRAIRHISDIVQGLKANMGVTISASGESLFMVDENGDWIDGERMLQVITSLVYKTQGAVTVAVPINVSGNIERIARKYGGEVLRTATLSADLLDDAAVKEAYMAGNGQGGVAFLSFHPSFDAMYCLGKIMEMMVITGESLGDLLASLPETHLMHSIVPCPWEAKGLVMRNLLEELGEEVKAIEGVRFEIKDDWVLIYPSSDHACVHIYAESEDKARVRDLISKWSRKVEGMQS